VSLATWRPGRRLRALVGAPAGDRAGGRRAFFFAEGQYLGTDTADNSARIRVLRAGPPEQVTLRYRLYEPTDEPCCPTGEAADVRYEWTGEELRLLDEMPAAELRTVRR
jgi:hypothetical protein